MSGRKNVILPYKLLDAQALSGSFNSKAVNVQYQDNIGIQIIATTTANTGLFSIEASIDGLTWDKIILQPPIAALAGANAVFTVNLNQIPFSQIRIHFEIGVGTSGTATAYITTKEI